MQVCMYAMKGSSVHPCLHAEERTHIVKLACTHACAHALLTPHMHTHTHKHTHNQVGFGTTKDRMIIVEGCPNLSAVTLFLRAGNKVRRARRVYVYACACAV